MTGTGQLGTEPKRAHGEGVTWDAGGGSTPQRSTGRLFRISPPIFSFSRISLSLSPALSLSCSLSPPFRPHPVPVRPARPTRPTAHPCTHPRSASMQRVDAVARRRRGLAWDQQGVARGRAHRPCAASATAGRRRRGSQASPDRSTVGGVGGGDRVMSQVWSSDEVQGVTACTSA